MNKFKKAEQKQEEAKEKIKDYSFPTQAEIVISTLGSEWCHREGVCLIWSSQVVSIETPPICCSNLLITSASFKGEIRNKVFFFKLIQKIKNKMFLSISSCLFYKRQWNTVNFFIIPLNVFPVIPSPATPTCHSQLKYLCECDSPLTYFRFT